VTRDDDAAGLFELTHQIPPASDIVRMMVRDSDDEDLVKRFSLDDQFDQKFRKQLKLWCQQQGVDELYMRYLWRAHWSIPSPGQLAQMLHRLSRLPATDPAFVGLETVKAALSQQDIAPFWQDKFVAISYAPLTRIDARRAFEIGALSEDQLLEAYLNLGYNRENGLTLVEFNKKNLQQKMLRRSEVQLLADGVISETDFDNSLTQWGADAYAIRAAKERATVLRRVQRNKRCAAAYRKRFLQGDFDAAEAENKLAALTGLTAEVHVIVEGWKCELISKGKLFTLSQLAGLYADGLIDETDFVRRAVRLGWEQGDAVIALRQVQRRQGIKAATAQQKELAAEQRAQDKLARQLRSAARNADVQARRQATDIQKARSVRDLRIKRVLEAAVKFSEHSGMTIPDAVVAVRAVYNAALNDFPVTPAEAVAALHVIVADKAINSIRLLTEALATALTTQAN